MTLFDGTIEEWKAAHPEIDHDGSWSPDKRRTVRNNAAIERGIHPVTHVPLLNAEWHLTCGDCDHHVVNGGHAKTYHKCDAVKMTAGPGTDIRLKWPACQKFRTS